MQRGIGHQIASGIVACFAGTIGCRLNFARMISSIAMIKKGRRLVTSYTGIRVAEPGVKPTMIDSTTDQGYRSGSRRMTTGAGVMAPGIIRIYTEGGGMTVGDAIGASAANQGTMVDNMSRAPIPMTIDAI